MEFLNSASSRSRTPTENMRALEKAVCEADQRINMRRIATSRAQIALALGFGGPLVGYLIYHFFAPNGVMQNYKTASGAYMNFAQTWMYRPRSITSVYRPEVETAFQSSPLVAYTKKIEAQRADGSLPEGVYHPTSWH